MALEIAKPLELVTDAVVSGLVPLEGDFEVEERDRNRLCREGEHVGPPVDVAFERNEARHDRVGYELERLRELERNRTAASDAIARLSAVLDTKAWRLTSPLRSAYGLGLRLRRRGR